LNLFSFTFSFSSFKLSLLFVSSSISSDESFSILIGSSISSFPSAIFSSSFASTSLESFSLAFSSSSLILSKSAFGI